MSFLLPSLNVAVTVSRIVSPGFWNAGCGGWMAKAITSPDPCCLTAPAAIHSWKAWYCHESTANRLPPPCWIWPLALSSTRLRSGSTGLMRRPNRSRLKA